MSKLTGGHERVPRGSASSIRSVIAVVGFAAAAALLAPLPAAQVVAQTPGQTVIYLVRHAEVAADGSQDPALSPAGRARAEQLAAMLKDAGITAVHSTDYRRTRETAAAVARATGRQVETYDPNALPAFADRLRRAGGRRVVIGHSNTTPQLVEALGGTVQRPIAESEYDWLYIVTTGQGTARTAVLRYPAPVSSLGAPTAAVSVAAAADNAAAVRPPPRPADVESIDAIIAALYDVISGPAGEPRDWDRMRSLFYPTARMLPVQRARDGRTVVRAITVDDYIERSGPSLVQRGFTESEVARRADRFGDVAHVFSTYRGCAGGETVTTGVNTIQLVFDGARWWISSIAWSAETADLELPSGLLPAGGMPGCI